MMEMAAIMGWQSSSAVHEGQQQVGGWRKGPWTPEEDKLLSEYVKSHGEGRWSSVSRSSGLNRSGKSCRLRWVNYLQPGLKRGHITPLEEGIIIELHALWGNKWSTIARYLPGRTDNEIKNYWRTHFKKKPEKGSSRLLRAQEKRWKTQRILCKQISDHRHGQQQPQDDQLVNADLHADQVIIRESSNEIVGELWNDQAAVNFKPDTEGKCGPMVVSEDLMAASWSEFIGEDVLWGGLWNLDDPQPGQAVHMTNCSKTITKQPNGANIIVNNNTQTGVFTYAGSANGFCSNAGYYIV